MVELEAHGYSGTQSSRGEQERVTMYRDLAVYRRCQERIQTRWGAFLERRTDRLRQQARHGEASEKVAEEILEDLFIDVLDWTPGNLDYQVGRADMILTRSGAKYLLVEVKRPGALRLQRAAVQRALDQARGYAEEQHVGRVAVSDGDLFFAADVAWGVEVPRCRLLLSSGAPPSDLWWVSMHGVYREPDGLSLACLPPTVAVDTRGDVAELLHPKYRLPARCFAYVGTIVGPGSWKLPYRLLDGGVDRKRLPKAIQAMLTTYRGEQVRGVPDEAVPAILLALGSAACEIGLMPHQKPDTADCYQVLGDALEQLGLLGKLPVE
jgi:hypothetical protein